MSYGTSVTLTAPLADEVARRLASALAALAS